MLGSYGGAYDFGKAHVPTGPLRASKRRAEDAPEGRPSNSHPSYSSGHPPNSAPTPPAPQRFANTAPPWSKSPSPGSASTGTHDPSIDELVRLTSRLALQTEQRVRAHIKLYQFCVLFCPNDDPTYGQSSAMYKDLLFKVASTYREVGKAHPRQPHPHGPNISTVVWTRFHVALDSAIEELRKKQDPSEEYTDHLNEFASFLALTGDDKFCAVATFVPLGTRNYAPREAQRFILKFDPTQRYGRESHEALSSLVLINQAFLPGFVIDHDRGPPSQLVKQLQQLTGDG